MNLALFPSLQIAKGYICMLVGKVRPRILTFRRSACGCCERRGRQTSGHGRNGADIYVDRQQSILNVELLEDPHHLFK